MTSTILLLVALDISAFFNTLVLCRRIEKLEDEIRVLKCK